MIELQVKRSGIHGVGLHVSEDVAAGEKIAYISGPIVEIKKFTPELRDNTANWIGVGRRTWINTDESIFRFINHSCDPNTLIVGRRTVIARFDIQAGTEITMDYSITESDCDWCIPECQCGTKHCRGVVSCISTLKRTVYERYLPEIPANFQKIYEVDNPRK